MNRRESQLGPRAGLLVLVLVAGVIGGCRSTQKSMVFDSTPATQDVRRFDRALKASIEAVQAGNLAEAESHIDAARSEAATYEQQRQVDSMAELCAGARAMLAADASAAKRHWTAIRDPHLNREVRNQVQVVLGLEVPMVANDEEVN